MQLNAAVIIKNTWFKKKKLFTIKKKKKKKAFHCDDCKPWCCKFYDWPRCHCLCNFHPYTVNLAAGVTNTQLYWMCETLAFVFGLYHVSLITRTCHFISTGSDKLPIEASMWCFFIFWGKRGVHVICEGFVTHRWDS